MLNRVSVNGYARMDRPVQYKSCNCIDDLSFSVADFGFLTVRNYFKMSHEKGPQDRAGANLKQKAEMAAIRHHIVI